MLTFLNSSVIFANMTNDWPNLIQKERDRIGYLEMNTDSESEVEWPEDEDML